MSPIEELVIRSLLFAAEVTSNRADYHTAQPQLLRRSHSTKANPPAKFIRRDGVPCRRTRLENHQRKGKP